MLLHAYTTSSFLSTSKCSDRVCLFDIIRGFTIVSMVAFHATYDLVYLYGIQIPWFTMGAAQELWRISISWVFLALAGWMTSFSHNNVRRACLYSAAALIIWIATTIVAVDTPISFGILFCMAGSTWVWGLLERTALKALEHRPFVFSTSLILAFLIFYRVPRHIYQVSGFAWLGFPSAGFSSGDYYPLIPFSFLYLAFSVLGNAWKQQGHTYPEWTYRNWCPVLSFIGTKSLPIYLLHQVAILAVLQFILG